MSLLRASVLGLGAVLAGASLAQAAGPNDLLPEAPAKPVVVKGCTSCHQAPQIVAKRRTPAEWEEVIGKMVDRGARLTEDEQEQVYDYFVRYFGPPPAPPAK